MYDHFYHLTTDPFGLNPDPRFCYSHPSYKKAMSYMRYALNRGEGFLLITGKPGTGKTTLVKDLIKGMENTGVLVTTLVTTQLEADDLLRSVAYSYNLPVENKDKATIIVLLKNYLATRKRHGHQTILVVDEAQDLSHGALEELRLLTNLELNFHPLLQIFLVGQPQLYKLLGSSDMEQLRQRITVATAMQPLSEQEVGEYVEHRLCVAGWHNDPEIRKEVYSMIYASSDGIPRRINQICSRLLLHGFVEEKHTLGREDIDSVLKELDEEQLSYTHKILETQTEPDQSRPAHTVTIPNRDLH